MTEDDGAVVVALRAGEERVFIDLVQRYQRPLLRLAQTFVPSQAVAEEVVRDTWIAVIKGIDRFEGRSNLRTWVFKILTYQAKSRGERERRSIPLSAFLPAGTEPELWRRTIMTLIANEQALWMDVSVPIRPA